MNFFKSIQQSKEKNVLQVCDHLLSFFSVKHTKYYLHDLIKAHVESNSMLAIKDVLSNYGIESAAIRKGNYSYCDFETPFISVIQQEDWPDASFTIITNVNDKNVCYLDPINNKIKEVSINTFEDIDKDIILLIDDCSKKDESYYILNRNTEYTQNFIEKTPIYLILSTILLLTFYLFSQESLIYSWLGIGYLFSSFLGLAITTLLIWHEVDAYNPFIREVCGGAGQKMNCESVLSSPKSSLFGISWSVFGFSFMATLFVTQIIYVGQVDQLLITSLLCILVSPYIIFSIYYQWRIVKQWCPLCVSVQAILMINAGFALIFFSKGFSLDQQISFNTIISTMFLGLLFLIITHRSIPILKQANASENYEKKWKKLRYNPDVFQLLLDKSESITVPTKDLGLVIGNSSAKYEIIKVCNPYCGPCSKAHPELEEIVKKNSNVRIRIIFKTMLNENNYLNKPVFHFLAIEQKYGKEIMRESLDNWYLSEKKDYSLFAEKYPMNGELKQQNEKILAMYNWCKSMKVRATPTIFINGKKLPDSYSIAELKNIF